MAVATKAAVAGGAGLVLVVVIVVIVVVLLQLQKQTPVPTAPVIVQAPGPTPGPAPTPAPAPEPTPSPTPSPVYSGPQSSLSVAGPAPAPIIQQIGLAAPPAEQGQIAALLNTLPDLLTGIGIGLAVEALLHADVIALKIVTRMRRTPALVAKLKTAITKVASRTLNGRMAKAFARMGMLARAKMGLRWGKTAARSGETVASSTTRAGAEAAALSADNGARVVATRIAEREAARGALMAVSAVFDAAAIAGLALDLTNTGNYSELVDTGDMRNMKAANDSQVVNTTIACSTWPIGAGCPQSPSPAPAPAPGPAPPPHEGRYPMFVGPLDAWAADTLDLAISNEFVRIFTSSDPPQSVKNLIADVSSRIGTDLGVDTISDTLFIMLCDQYLTSTELENIHNLAFDNICVSEGGATFVPGNGYEKACSYSSKDTCHAAFPWPPPNNDNQDLTYTEWRAKSWFSQWNTITPDNIPTGGACIAADPSIHQMCDEEVGTASGRATNRYIRETGECVNTRDMCRIKGVSYRDSDPPTCYMTDAQTLAELLFGSTIVRFIMSGGRLRLHPDLITTVVTVTIPPVNSGNSTVDTAVNTVSSGLSSAAAEISNAGIAAANAIQAGLVSATNQVVTNVAAAIAGTVTVVAPAVQNVVEQVAIQAAGAQGSTLALALDADLSGATGYYDGPGTIPSLKCDNFPGVDIINLGSCRQTCPSDRVKIDAGVGGYCYKYCKQNMQRGQTLDTVDTCDNVGEQSCRQDRACPLRVCPSGSTLQSDQKTCCPANTFFTGIQDKCCPTGGFLASDKKTCCPANSTFSGTEGICCPQGTTVASDKKTCCPVNTFFTGVSGKCCPTGTTFSATSGSCVCPANAIYDTSVNDCKCSPGFIKSTDGLSCISLSCSGRTLLQL